jgi:hypothetical protein
MLAICLRDLLCDRSRERCLSDTTVAENEGNALEEVKLLLKRLKLRCSSAQKLCRANRILRRKITAEYL